MSIIRAVQFHSFKNYMKRSSVSGSSTMSGPNTDKIFSFRSYKTIPHNLGYVPLFRLYYEPYIDGRIMEAYNDSQNWIGPDPNNFIGPETAPTVFAYADEFNLYVELVFIDGSLSANTYPIHYVIYRDYGVNP